MEEDDLIHHLCVCVCVWVDTQNIMCGPTSQPSGEGLPRTEGTFSSARLQERRQHEGRLLQERDHTQTQNRQPQDGEETDPASTLSDGSLLLWLLTVRGQQQLYRERLTESKWLTPHRMFRTELHWCCIENIWVRRHNNLQEQEQNAPTNIEIWACIGEHL